MNLQEPEESEDDLDDGVGHIPVMLDEVIEALRPQPGEWAVDTTAGLAGHSLALLGRLVPGGRLLALDRDPRIAALAQSALSQKAPPGATWQVMAANGSALPEVLESIGWLDGFDLFLMDCGVCSVHFDMPELGFSMRRDGPLDMKLTPDEFGPDASELVNEGSPEGLLHMLRVLGEEPQARRIVDAIVAARRKGPIETTAQLASIVYDAYPARFRGGRRHPATRTFQALRLAVNGELDALAQALRHALTHMRVGGRGALISFMSLEATLIKRTLRAASTPPPSTSADWMRRSGDSPLVVLPSRAPSDGEIERNPRSRSARLWTFTKLAPLSDNITWPRPPATTNILP